MKHEMIHSGSLILNRDKKTKYPVNWDNLYCQFTGYCDSRNGVMNG